ncbi:hypothetical protein ACFO1B_50935 [Dactylosporangium siamense]|uniref:Uncharacterized protein n=1 Tax=Dactylosporangium siamense TaxID=685454 RepID=A0A919Q106_9ACTN|nr:hypothetical protein [Dactylosporangium siamense]GIG52388.1 hypothetical protein Dsi01nite_104290 [Dactylosporangium siamense]
MAGDGFNLVTESDVVALAGAGARAYRTLFATYVLGPDVFIVVVEPGDRPHGTAVQDRELLKLTGPFPDEVNTLLYHDLTHRGHRSPATQNGLHGFVRVHEGCVPLGPMTCSGGGWDPDEEQLIEYRLSLKHALPFDALDQVRPPRPAPPTAATAWLDLLPDDPVAATHEFITGWYADVPPVDNHAEPSQQPIPAPLAAFHATAAGRDEILGRQDALYPLSTLRVREDGWLTFGGENQGGFTLAVDPTAPDPAVAYWLCTGESIIDPHPLSTFLLLFALREASFTGPYLATAGLTADEAQQLTRGLRRIPLRNGWFPSTDVEFHVGGGLVVQLSPRDDATCYAFISARHRAHLEPLRHLGIRWQTFHG